MDFSDFILHQKELIAANRTGQSLEDLKTVFRESGDIEIFNSILFLDSQYNKLQEEKRNGIISHDNEVLEFNRINYRLIKFLDKLSFEGRSIYYDLPHLFINEDFEEISVAERVLWNYIDSIKQNNWYREYIIRFPKGFYISKAKYKLDSEDITISNGDQIYVTLKNNGHNDIRMVFYATKSLKIETFLSDIANNLKTLYDLKKSVFGENWILKKSSNDFYILGPDDLNIDDLMGEAYSVTILGTKQKRLSTNAIIDFNRIDYEKTIRTDVLPFLESNDVLRKQVEAEINEIIDLETNANLEVIKKESVSDGKGDLYFGLISKKEFYTHVFLIAFFWMAISIYFLVFFWSGELEFNSKFHLIFTIMLFGIILFEYIFGYFWINLTLFNNLNSSRLGNVCSLIISCCFMSWYTIVLNEGRIHKHLMFSILDLGVTAFVYLISLLAIGTVVKLVNHVKNTDS